MYVLIKKVKLFKKEIYLNNNYTNLFRRNMNPPVVNLISYEIFAILRSEIKFVMDEV